MTRPDPDAIFEILQQIFREHAFEILPQSRLRELRTLPHPEDQSELPIDSLDLVEIAIAIEERWDIDLDSQALEECVEVGDLVNLIVRTCQTQAVD